ncbi:hypothetical protein CRYUN_Cryun09bG0043400 [Craigia yunnanensis]
MVDYKGHHFEFIPFGSGRRMCPAVPLASRLLPMALGSLLHSFDWTLADGLKPEDLDITERMEELDRVIGPKRQIEESDMDELPYLQAVIKETLRLHPAIPLPLPRNTMQETNYLGYLIPKEIDFCERMGNWKRSRIMGGSLDIQARKIFRLETSPQGIEF